MDYKFTTKEQIILHAWQVTVKNLKIETFLSVKFLIDLKTNRR